MLPTNTDHHLNFTRLGGTTLLLFLLLAGFWFRIDFWLAEIYHTDEYISMLAAKMVAAKGLPILPSGLFYDHGLLFSFLSGGLTALLDFREAIARWPSVLAGILTIAVYYVGGRSLFGSRTSGLFAAALSAFDAMSIQWGARARMYALAHLFVLFSLIWLLRSMFQRPSERSRYLFLIFVTTALLSHTVTFVILIPLGLLTLIYTLVYSRQWVHQKRLWLQAGVGIAMLSGAMLIVRLGQTSSTISLQDAGANASPLAKLGFLGRFFLPGLEWSRFENLTFFFFEPPYNWLALLIFLGTLVTLYRLFTRQMQFSDVAFSFLAVYIILVVLEVGGLLESNWHKTRYLFMLNLPAFFLIAAESLSRLLQMLKQGLCNISPVLKTSRWTTGVFYWLGALIIVVFMGPQAWQTAQAQSTGYYHTAFKFVKEQMQPGDKVMTIHPAAAYLYLQQSDYYANQVTAKVLASKEDPMELVDRYTGSPLIASVEALNEVIAQEERLWFVVDISRLYRRYDFFFTQQIFSQMNYVKQFGLAYVFTREAFPHPLPPEPDIPLDAQFDKTVRLEGYSLNLNTLGPDGSLPLHLYWQPIGDPPRDYKVFVQLRNKEGQTIAQADHYFFETLLKSKETRREWNDLRQKGEWLRETATFHLPIPFSQEQGPYQVYIGLYHAETFERLPLLNDSSGENAVILPFS